MSNIDLVDLFRHNFGTGFLVSSAIFFLIVLWGLVRRNQRFQIRSMKTEKIAEADNGYCHLEGRAESLNSPPLMSPVTETPCVWFDAYYDKGSFLQKGYRKIFGRYHGIENHDRTAGWFLLHDDTGVCLVDTQIASIHPTKVNRQPSAGESSGESGDHVETFIELGAMLTVLGHLTAVPAEAFEDISHESTHFSHTFQGRHLQESTSFGPAVDLALHKIDTDVKLRIQTLLQENVLGDPIRILTSTDNVHEPVLIQGSE